MSAFEVVLLLLLLVAVALLLRSRQVARERAAQWEKASRERAEALKGLQDANLALATAGRQIDGLGEAALDALLLLDAGRHIVWANQSAWDLFSGGNQAAGQLFVAVVNDYELNQAVGDALSGRRAIVRQSAVKERTLRIRAVPLPEGRGAAVVIEDVTELQRLGRARRDFVANISHDLRTPLANIDLAAQTLRAGALAEPGLSVRLLDQIESQVQALIQLSQEMMDLAQIESGRVLLKLVQQPVEPIARGAIELLLPQAVLKHQDLTVDIAPDLTALVDEQQVARVIRNLVHNAIKFTPEGGAIQICATPSGQDDVLFCVSDNGPGVPDADQTRIFERFYKADRARSQGGTGLGLAIARHIVEGHGGHIWTESQAPRGARFCFTLPRA